MFEALQEYYMMETLKKNTSGVVNLAFSLNEDSLATEKYAVSIERISNNVIPKRNKISAEIEEIEVNNISESRRCRHNNRIKVNMSC